MRPRRSALYVPGSNRRAIDKAGTLDADVLIFDLEDAVAPDRKDEARRNICAALGESRCGSREWVVRINGLNTPWGAADLAAVAGVEPDAVLVPKIMDAADVEQASRALAHRAPATRLWVMIETPRAVLNAESIARSALTPGARLSVLVIGVNDLANETKASLDGDRRGLLAWLSASVLAARAYGLGVLDGVFNALDDVEGLRRECLQGRDLGMDGKTLIHPRQIAIANEAFAPSENEIAEARRILAAFDKPENAGKGAIAFDGRMIERLHADMARERLARAEAVGFSKP